MDQEELSLQSQKAIKCALSQRWEEAKEINLAIIKHHGENIDALNRLGTVFINLKDEKKAKHYFDKALKLDPLNSIASKNIKLIKAKKVMHQELVPETYNLKATIKNPDRKTRQKTKPYIKHAGLEGEDIVEEYPTTEEETENMEEESSET